MADTETLRRALLQQRHRLLAQVARLEDELRWLEAEVEPELVENGQEATLALLAGRLDEHDRAELEAIERALARIEAGTYGRCFACGEAIPAERLAALPATELCRPCAEAREGLQRT